VVALVAAVGLAGCGDDDEARFAAARRKAALTTTTAVTDTGAPGALGEPSTRPSTTSTTAPVPATPAESLLAAVTAYRQALPGPIRALRFTTHLPGNGVPYASLQSQDPAVPANVDERAWRNGQVGPPEPVRLTGTGTLEESLFSLDEINWDAVAAALAGAPALVEQQLGRPLDGSDGVTHIIATKDLPFSPATVVRVYVDGGDRTTGGYVELLADGSVGEVQA
jgi:hypothetical protein